MKKKLKIGIISRVESKTIERALAQEAERRGHEYTIIPFISGDISNSEAVCEEAGLLDFDVLYYRTSLGYVWAQVLETYLHTHNRRAVNLRYNDHSFLEKKTFQTTKVASAGFVTPKTIIDSTDEYAKLVGELGVPFVAKADTSSQGKDVHLIHTEEEFNEVAATRFEKKIFYQEYIPHDFDCRVHLVGGKAVASYRRLPAGNEFRCNISQGGSMEALSERDKEITYPLAEKIAEVLGLELHVVDFMHSTKDDSYIFTEINSNPGWEVWDEEATGVDMNMLVMDYLEKVAEE